MLSRVRAAAPVPLSIEACWERFRDLTRPTYYVPGVVETIVTTEKKEGLGASRRVRHRQFGEMDETVVEWHEGRGMRIRLHRGDRPSPPFAEAYFVYLFHDVGQPDACEIHTAMEYRLPGGVLGRLAERLVMRRLFRSNVTDVAVSLAEHYRTGEAVDPSRLPELRRNALPLSPEED